MVEVVEVSPGRAERIQRILADILESGLPLPDLDLAGGLTPAAIDAIQAAILRVEIAKSGRVAA